MVLWDEGAANPALEPSLREGSDNNQARPWIPRSQGHPHLHHCFLFTPSPQPGLINARWKNEGTGTRRKKADGGMWPSRLRETVCSMFRVELGGICRPFSMMKEWSACWERREQRWFLHSTPRNLDLFLRLGLWRHFSRGALSSGLHFRGSTGHGGEKHSYGAKLVAGRSAWNCSARPCFSHLAAVIRLLPACALTACRERSEHFKMF